MSKFGGLFARKAGLFDKPAEPRPTGTLLPDNPLEIDEELFSALGAQIGGDNESLRNLMLDANAKIGELDTIKAAVGKLVDPLAKTLRAFEAEKSEKISLQSVLNNTRTAYGKLRNEVAELEKKASTSESECRALRQELTTTQNMLRALETTKAEIAIDIAARRAQIIDLEARLAQETGEGVALRDENRRLDEKLATADKRIISLESDLNGARQRLLMAEDEKRAQQASLDRSTADAARLSRKLAETEASLNAAQGRLRHVEGNFAEISNERSRLAAALDEANERHGHDLASHRTRFDALQARAMATDKLLVEARETLLARAEEIREHDRRTSDIAMERDGLQGRVAELEADRINRESELKEIGQAHASLIEQSSALARAYTAKEAALARAEDANGALNQRIVDLETALSTDKQTTEQQIEDLNAALRREKLERSVTEGALETGRKDFARLMREVMALQRSQQEAEQPIQRAANAA
jgi:crescentin